jgi:hypothetical protein
MYSALLHSNLHHRLQSRKLQPAESVSFPPTQKPGKKGTLVDTEKEKKRIRESKKIDESFHPSIVPPPPLENIPVQVCTVDILYLEQTQKLLERNPPQKKIRNRKNSTYSFPNNTKIDIVIFPHVPQKKPERNCETKETRKKTKPNPHKSSQP